jgi:GTPase SAR1 family protein
VGAILVYSIASLHSFDELAGWLVELQKLATPNAYILLVGNKADLEAERQVAVDEVRKFSEAHRIDSIETSARSGKNMNEVFARLSLEVSARVKTGAISVPSVNRGSEQTGVDTQGEAKGCC